MAWGPISKKGDFPAMLNSSSSHIQYITTSIDAGKTAVGQTVDCYLLYTSLCYAAGRVVCIAPRVENVTTTPTSIASSWLIVSSLVFFSCNQSSLVFFSWNQSYLLWFYNGHKIAFSNNMFSSSLQVVFTDTRLPTLRPFSLRQCLDTHHSVTYHAWNQGIHAATEMMGSRSGFSKGAVIMRSRSLYDPHYARPPQFLHTALGTFDLLLSLFSHSALLQWAKWL